MPEGNSGPLNLSDGDIRTYRRDGAVLLRGMLAPHWVELVARGLDEIRDQPGALASTQTDGERPGALVAEHFASRRNSSLARFVRESPAARIAGRLMGWRSSHLYLDQMFYKDGGRVLPSAWHQDVPYLKVRGRDMCRVWMSCDRAPRSIALRVVRGSHLWNVVYRRPVSDLQEQSAGSFSYQSAPADQSLPPLPDIEASRDSFDILHWDVEPGDVIAFNGLALHGAGGLDDWPARRRAFATLWCGEQETYLKRPGHTLPDLADLAGAAMQDGESLAGRPDLYPAYWRAA